MLRTWIAHLAGRVKASLAASGGVEDAGDVAAYLLAGADVVMTTSALLRRRADYAMVVLGGLTGWMARKGYTSLREARGLLASAGPGGAPANGLATSSRCGRPTGRAALVTRSVPGDCCRRGGRCPGGFRGLGRCV